MSLMLKILYLLLNHFPCKTLFAAMNLEPRYPQQYPHFEHHCINMQPYQCLYLKGVDIINHIQLKSQS